MTDLPPPPPPAPTQQTSTILAEPGHHILLEHENLDRGGPILARSTATAGFLSAPIQLHLDHCSGTSSATEPIIYVSNAQADIRFTNCRLERPSAHLVCAQEAEWGMPGYNSASIHLRADHSTLRGDIYVGKRCRVILTLGHASAWYGRFTGPGQATIYQHSQAVWQPSTTPTPK